MAVNRVTGDFIVTERSPTHQIQIYNQYGQFLRKFGANILQHPRGVCVDNKGRIIVIECKVSSRLFIDLFIFILLVARKRLMSGGWQEETYLGFFPEIFRREWYGNEKNSPSHSWREREKLPERETFVEEVSKSHHLLRFCLS